MIRYGLCRLAGALRAGCLWLACELVAAAEWFDDLHATLETEP